MPELRKDPVVERWVIIATERGRRPSDFPVQSDPPSNAFCPFCAGNEAKTPPEAAQWGRDPDAAPDTSGWTVRVVPNKFPALSPGGDLDRHGVGLYDAMTGVGAHEVVIESPRHDWDFPGATTEEARLVVGAYIARVKALRHDPRFLHTLVFRNNGTVAGASQSHPHAQIIALPFVPGQVSEQMQAALAHYKRKTRCVWCDVLRQELSEGARVVEENEHFVVLSPYASRFPFQMQLLPRRHSPDFTRLTPPETEALGQTLVRALGRIKGTLSNPAYNLMVQSAPHQLPHEVHGAGGEALEHSFHWHIDILPRLTEIAGFEWGTGCSINPVAPEQATRFLKDEG